jgi:hypothetical protein
LLNGATMFPWISGHGILIQESRSSAPSIGYAPAYPITEHMFPWRSSACRRRGNCDGSPPRRGASPESSSPGRRWRACSPANRRARRGHGQDRDAPGSRGVRNVQSSAAFTMTATYMTCRRYRAQTRHTPRCSSIQTDPVDNEMCESG